MSLLPRRSASVSIDLTDVNILVGALRFAAPQAVDRGMRRGMRAATIDVAGRVKELINGEVLNRRTGRLWKSIQPEVAERLGRVIGIVGTDVKYAAIHEFGGIIRPRSESGRLAFRIGDDFVMTSQVEMPRRPFMSRAATERTPQIKRLLAKYVMQEVRGAVTTDNVLPVGQRKAVGFSGD